MAEALNTCTLSVQCPPEHLHVLSASVQGTGTSYSGARQGVFLCHKNRFVLQNALPPEPSLCGGSAPKSPPNPIQKTNPMNRPKKTPARPEMGRPHQSRPEAKGGDEREVKGALPFVHTKIGQTRGTFIPSACPITVR